MYYFSQVQISLTHRTTLVMEPIGIKTTDQVYIIVNEDGADWIVQTQDNAPIKGATIEESAQNHINHILGEQAAALEDANKPTELELLQAKYDKQASDITDINSMLADLMFGGV